MIWLAVYIVTGLLLLGLLFRYGFRRSTPQKCYSCEHYDDCPQHRDGKCLVSAERAVPVAH